MISLTHLETPIGIPFPAEMIQIETARRLHSIHLISTKDIDRMGILKPLRETHNRGLLWEKSQRLACLLISAQGRLS